jgi:hypothetical protein
MSLSERESCDRTAIRPRLAKQRGRRRTTRQREPRLSDQTARDLKASPPIGAENYTEGRMMRPSSTLVFWIYKLMHCPAHRSASRPTATARRVLRSCPKHGSNFRSLDFAQSLANDHDEVGFHHEPPRCTWFDVEESWLVVQIPPAPVHVTHLQAARARNHSRFLLTSQISRCTAADP